MRYGGLLIQPAKFLVFRNLRNFRRFPSLALRGCVSLIYVLAQWLRELCLGKKRFRVHTHYF